MLYIRLFHGRTDPNQDMDDWGTDGPIFGPYLSVHTTYACRIKMIKADSSFHELLVYPEDTIFYDGVYYGDWSIFDTDILDNGRYQVSRFAQSKANLPAK
jgi:hypothetical protein